MSTQGGAALERLLATVNQAPASFYATRSGFPFRAWEKLPILSGAELASEIADHPPFGRLSLRDEQPIRTALATAVVPRPVPMCWTQPDLDAEAQLGARTLRRTGLRPRGRTSDCLDGGLVTPGTLAITDALDALDALALPVGPLLNEAALARAREVWGIVQPTLLITANDTFAFLANAADAPDVTHALLLTPDQSSALAGAARAHVYRVLSLPIVATFLAGECSAHDGLHVADDAVWVEVVDSVGTAVPDGRPGRLIVSTLQRCNTILRLDTGVVAALDRAPCRCGETGARIRIA